jgi:hypothetical protein
MTIDEQTLQQVVSDVCTGMLGLELEPSEHFGCDESDSLSAVIRISGDWDSLVSGSDSSQNSGGHCLQYVCDDRRRAVRSRNSRRGRGDCQHGWREPEGHRGGRVRSVTAVRRGMRRRGSV